MLTLVAFILLFVFYVFLGVKKPGLALVTCPIPLIVGVIQTNPFFISIAVAIIFVTALTIVFRARTGDVDNRWPQRWARATVWVLGSTALLVVLVRIFKPLGFIFWAIFVALVVYYKTIRWRSITMHVISTIGAGMRQNLPLVMVLESAAANQGDKQANTLREISKWLVQGYSLAEAIKRGYPKCPPDIVATIAAGEKVNQLPQVIRSIEENLTGKADARRRIQPVHPSYPAIVLLIAGLILFFIMLKIIPVFSAVLLDMSEGEIGLPKSTAFLLAMTSSMTENHLLLLVLSVVFIVGGPVLIYARLRSRRPEIPYLISRISDFIKWHMPIMHWFEFNYSMLRLVGLLRVSLNSGCAVNDAIRNSLGLDVNNCFRNHMSGWLERIEAGEDISSAARESGMGNTLAWAFDSDVNRGNTPDILEMLEEFYRSNYSYRVALARFILEPCIILMLGVTVGFVIRAIFLPMVTMLHYAADSVVP